MSSFNNNQKIIVLYIWFYIDPTYGIFHEVYCSDLWFFKLAESYISCMLKTWTSWKVHIETTAYFQWSLMLNKNCLPFRDHLRFSVGFVMFDGLVFCVVLCRSLLSIFFLCCLSFFDFRILITPLVSSNSSFSNVILLIEASNSTSETAKVKINYVATGKWLQQ